MALVADKPKLCECGCGLPAPIATKSSTNYGWVKGKPKRFIKGHWVRGRRDESHPSWRGDEVSYPALHLWLRETFPKTGICVNCGEKPKPFANSDLGTDLANISGKYHRDRSDYLELCRSCHTKMDTQRKSNEKE